MWERACVGAGLLAKAVGQQYIGKLIHRIREQARTHTDCARFSRGVALLRPPTAALPHHNRQESLPLAPPRGRIGMNP